MTLIIFLLVAAVVCLLLAAFGAGGGKVNLWLLGLAFLIIAALLKFGWLPNPFA